MRTGWVGVAGFFGAIARYRVGDLVRRHVKGAFPWGTLVVNVSGCFLLGVLVTLLTERFVASETVRIAITVGFVGTYTTFSAFAYELLRGGQDGALGLALANLVGSVAAGVTAVWLGMQLARAVS